MALVVMVVSLLGLSCWAADTDRQADEKPLIS